MDHISLSHQTNGMRVQVSCLYRHRDDDFPPFVKYPGIMGWTEQDVRYPGNWSSDSKWDSSTPRKPKQEAELLLQGWLYFGLVRTFFAEDSTPLFQSRDHTNRCFVSSKFLPQLLTLQQAYYLNMDARHLKHVLTLQKYCLAKTREVLRIVYEDHSRVDESIVFSIAVLGQTLESFIYRRQIDRQNDLEGYNPLLPLNHWPLGSTYKSDLVSRKLRSAGWCPHEIRRIGRLSPTSRYLVSFMDRPHPEIRHGTKCDELRCTAYNMDIATYETEHVCETGKCDWLPSDGQTLSNILESGDIPVVSFQETEETGPKLRLLKASQCKEYIAYSHVWSDRLGNPRENAMPLCQIRRLALMARELFPDASSTVAFWIDTLCCPVDPESATRRAIVLMRKTYL